MGVILIALAILCLSIAVFLLGKSQLLPSTPQKVFH